MDRIITVVQIIAPIFVTLYLGLLTKKKNLMSAEGIQGFQHFVMNFGLPCVLFNSCLTANVGAESLYSMLLTLPFLLIGCFWAFGPGRNLFPYHNLPMVFCSQETGMLGIPLFIVLFGAAESYRVGMLDLTQALTAIPTIAILSANAGDQPSKAQIAKKVFASPLMIMSLLGLTLNLSGISKWLEGVGILPIINETTQFLSAPISTMMIFSIGYNFSFAPGNRKAITKLCTVHFLWFLLVCGIIQLGLSLAPNVDPLTRWAVLLYCTLPASYLTPSLGRTKEDSSVASGVCSVLTVVSLLIFCVMAALLA